MSILVDLAERLKSSSIKTKTEVDEARAIVNQFLVEEPDGDPDTELTDEEWNCLDRIGIRIWEYEHFPGPLASGPAVA